MKRYLLIAGFALALSIRSAWSDDGHASSGDEGNDVLDSTLTLIPEGAELPAVVTENIELPKDGEDYLPAVQGVEHGGAGLETANFAREEARALREAFAAAAEQDREDVRRRSKPDLDGPIPNQVPSVSDASPVAPIPASAGQP